MGKKKPEELAKNFTIFQEGARRNGYSDESIQALWDVLVPFAGYAFNKAHSAAYGLVSYWTAYLKANYPAEYMAALLTSVRDDKDKSAIYLNECRRMGIRVLPPNVNESDANFTAQGDDVILFGLTAVRNVGQNVVDSIIRCRKSKGKYTSFPDFLDKVEAVVCNKRTVESLIKAGAYDEMGHTRKGLTEHYEPMIDNVVAVKRKEAEGQFDLFGGMGDDAEATNRASGSTSPSPTSSGTRRTCSRRSARCSACTSPTTRSSASSTSSTTRRTPPSRRWPAITPTARSSPSAASSPVSSAR